MKDNHDSLKESFEKELEQLHQETVLSPNFRRKKTIFWCIRTVIALTLFIMLWEHKWVKWGLIIYIPLSLISLFSIYGSQKILNKKIERTRTNIEKLNNENH